MKTLIALLITCSLTAQIQFNKAEYFTASLSIDPTASIKEKGLNVVAEVEYVGLIYAKASIESFDVLPGGYFSYGAAIGTNVMIGKRVRNYIGIRGGAVRRNGATNGIYGFEAGIDVNITDNLFIGLRATYDKRYDMIALQNPVIWRENGFIRIGYKFN